MKIKNYFLCLLVAIISFTAVACQNKNGSENAVSSGSDAGITATEQKNASSATEGNNSTPNAEKSNLSETVLNEAGGETGGEPDGNIEENGAVTTPDNGTVDSNSDAEITAQTEVPQDNNVAGKINEYGELEIE